MIKSLQSFRALFSVIIFLGHFPFAYASPFVVLSDCAVSYFLILSGFVTCLAHEQKILTGQYNFRTFSINRFKRIYPLHILCMVLISSAILIMHIAPYPTVPQIIANLLLIQSWVPEYDIYFSMNGVAWFLSTLMFCYIVAVPIIRLCDKHLKAVIAVTTLAIASYLSVLPFIPDSRLFWFLYIFPVTRVIDFILGILLFQGYKRLKTAGYTPKPYIGITTFAIILITGIASYYLPERITLACWWWMPMSVMILYLSMRNENDSTVSRILSSSRLVRFGNMSFSFYMLHSITIAVCLALFYHTAPDASDWVKLAVSFATAYIMAILCSRYFESKIISKC